MSGPALSGWNNRIHELTHFHAPELLTTGHHMTALGPGHGSEYGGVSNGFIGFPTGLLRQTVIGSMVENHNG